MDRRSLASPEAVEEYRKQQSPLTLANEEIVGLRGILASILVSSGGQIIVPKDALAEIPKGQVNVDFDGDSMVVTWTESE